MSNPAKISFLVCFALGVTIGYIIKSNGLIGPKYQRMAGGEPAGSFSTLPSAYADLERNKWTPRTP